MIDDIIRNLDPFINDVGREISEVFRTPNLFDWLENNLGFVSAIVAVIVLGVLLYFGRRKR